MIPLNVNASARSGHMSERIDEDEEDVPNVPSRRSSADRRDSRASSRPRVVSAAELVERSAVRRLLSSPIYMWTVLGLAALFFVVTGIQFWVTKYLIVVIGKQQADVTAAFGVTSITAPIAGVFIGGTIIDKLGGYQGAVATARTLRVCAFFAVLAASSAALCAFVPKVAGSDDPDLGFWLTISLIALTLLFGGAIIPAATAIIVSAVDPDLRQLASAGSIFMFQQLGYAASPLISSLVGSAASVSQSSLNATLVACGTSCDQRHLSDFSAATLDSPADFSLAMERATEYVRVELCFTVVMCWGFIGLFCLSMGAYVATKAAKGALAEADAESCKPRAEASVGAGGGAAGGIRESEKSGAGLVNTRL